jgi:hypothetical protein
MNEHLFGCWHLSAFKKELTHSTCGLGVPDILVRSWRTEMFAVTVSAGASQRGTAAVNTSLNALSIQRLKNKESENISFF